MSAIHLLTFMSNSSSPRSLKLSLCFSTVSAGAPVMRLNVSSSESFSQVGARGDLLNDLTGMEVPFEVI